MELPLPEVLQTVAQFLPSCKDFFAFVHAIPQSHLTRPLQNLLDLAKQIDPLELWPAPIGIDDITDEDIISLIQPTLCLYPSITFELIHDSFFDHLIPSTNVHLKHILYHPKQFDIILTHYRQYTTTLGLDLIENSSRQYTPSDIKQLSHALPQLPKLENLRFDVMVSWDSSVLDCLLSAVHFLHLKSLKLNFMEHNGVIDYDSVRYLAQCIHIPFLENIKLYGLSVPSNDICIARALINSLTLKSISLRNCNFINHFFQLGGHLPKQLKRLIVHFSESIDLEMVAQTIADSNVQEIEFVFQSDQVFQTNGVHTLTTTIANLKHIKSLALGRLQFDETSIQSLTQIIPRLGTLRLQQNGITLEFLKQIATVLPTSSHLHTVQLSHQNIGNEGATALSAALNDRNLKLYLNGNDIGPLGAESLTSVLDKSLILNLDDNPLEEEGCLTLINYLVDHEDTECALSISNTRMNHSNGLACWYALQDLAPRISCLFSIAR
ncbi:hypothetical protein THRCLA_00463 [Thraustotheca clavata]|uniref:RNI-like protein n=1 Tax=Thraustotheca clavata TaxID=74557 RepID=A0A1W0ABH3_9STRA|nr:hypothetical protein THRCLA_00463 [Thraustotheca clavata]